MWADCDGKVVVVTGAAAGLGLSLSRSLARRGAQVWMADLDLPACERAAARVPGASPLALDVTSAEAFEAAIAQVLRAHGRCDLLINNAGVGLAGEAQLCSAAEQRRVVEVNLMGVIHGVAAVYPHMVAAGAGAIVNIASAAGLMPLPVVAAYSASKHAVVAYSLALRAEAAAHGVEVMVACPGWLDTGLYRAAPLKGWVTPQLAQRLCDHVAMSPDDCAEGVLRGLSLGRMMVIVPRSLRLGWGVYRLSPMLWQRLATKGLALVRRRWAP